MKNINKISLVGGLVFAVFDAICALFSAFALKPFLAFWSVVAHIRWTGVGVESHVTPVSFIFWNHCHIRGWVHSDLALRMAA